MFSKKQVILVIHQGLNLGIEETMSYNLLRVLRPVFFSVFIMQSSHFGPREYNLDTEQQGLAKETAWG